MDFNVKYVLLRSKFLLFRLVSKRKVQFLSTQSLDLSSGGNYVQHEADIPAERQNDSGKLFQRKQVVTIFINSSSLPRLIPQPSSLKISMQILSCCIIPLTSVSIDFNHLTSGDFCLRFLLCKGLPIENAEINLTVMDTIVTPVTKIPKLL